VLALPTERLRGALDTDPALRDVVLRTYLLRRAMFLGLSAVKLVGSGTSSEMRRLREFLAAREVDHSWLDLDTDEHAATLLEDMGVGPEETPVAITRDRRVLRHPTESELAAALGLEV
jgi:hypothetical protein